LIFFSVILVGDSNNQILKMVITNEVLILSVLLVLAFLFVWSQCTLSCKNFQAEGYKRASLSQTGPMNRSPVTTAFRGDGMSENPHYQADPSDRLVPLEYGGVDFYAGERRVAAGLAHRELAEDYKGRGKKATHLINDSKTRQDMVDAGDIGWHRLLNNMVTTHAEYPGAPRTVADLATAGPEDYDQGLYSPSYHQDHIGN